MYIPLLLVISIARIFPYSDSYSDVSSLVDTEISLMLIAFAACPTLTSIVYES